MVSLRSCARRPSKRRSRRHHELISLHIPFPTDVISHRVPTGGCTLASSGSTSAPIPIVLTAGACLPPFWHPRAPISPTSLFASLGRDIGTFLTPLSQNPKKRFQAFIKCFPDDGVLGSRQGRIGVGQTARVGGSTPPPPAWWVGGGGWICTKTPITRKNP